MAIVVDLQLGRSLAAVGPHNAVVELLDETTRGARDHPGDLAHHFCQAYTSPSACRQRSAVNQAVIECRRLSGHWGDSETVED